MRCRLSTIFSPIVGICLCAVPALAQPVPQLPEVPVEGARDVPTDTGMGDQTPFGQPRGTISWDSGAITSSSTPVGPYGQPSWTTTRPFAGTRAYVLPPGQMQYDQWYRPKWPRQGKVDQFFQHEIEIGLPGRFQLDVYEDWRIKQFDEEGKLDCRQEGVQIELRWAFADWGVIPLNPTLYVEWVQRGHGEPDKYEFKFLLADTLIEDALFYAANVNFEQEVGGDHETEVVFSQGFSMPIIDRKLLAGCEMILKCATVTGHRSDPAVEFSIGPSMQYIFNNRMFLNVVPLFGTTKDAPLLETFFVFTYQFGYRAGPTSEISGPTASRGL